MMAGGVRFLRAELDYGCHAGRAFEFRAAASPAVILGPNGSGKSTLLEALVRALFGFNRRQQAERTRLESRRPWGAEQCRAALVLTDSDGARWRLERSFGDARVRIERLDPPGGVWEGEGNPAAGNEDAREYRRRLACIIGFADIEPYAGTAWIQQGALRSAAVGDHLLRLATGGHRDVERAREKLRDAYRSLTARRLDAEDSGGRKARRLEEIEEQIALAEESLAQAEAAERRRGPLLAERGEAAARVAAIEAEIDLLEAAQGPVAERKALEAKRDGAEARLRALERAELSLRAALDEHRDAAAAWRECAARPLYPDDFLERLARLDSLWRQRALLTTVCEDREASLRGMRPPTIATVATAVLFALAAAGGALVATGRTALGLAALLVGLVGGMAALRARQRAAEQREGVDREAALLRARLQDAEAEIAGVLDGVPDADTLTAQTAPDRRDRFERQRAAERRAGAAAERLREVVEATAAATGSDAADLERAGASLDDVATHVLERAGAATEAARLELAQIAVKLEQADAAAFRLPDGVPAEHGAILRALQERREELRALRARMHALDRALLEATTGTESAVAIRDRLHALNAEREEVEAAAAAYAAAYALLGDAYAEFRGRDQQRLVRLISERLVGITRARLGPLQANGSLADAQVHAFGRVVPIASPPLSYGERHAAALAIRIGAADFLAANGIEPPLLVDEPFAYLDPDRATHVWELLTRIAEQRQVIIATQDRLVLEHLGVEADVVLGG